MEYNNNHNNNGSNRAIKQEMDDLLNSVDPQTLANIHHNSNNTNTNNSQFNNAIQDIFVQDQIFQQMLMENTRPQSTNSSNNNNNPMMMSTTTSMNDPSFGLMNFVGNDHLNNNNSNNNNNNNNTTDFYSNQRSIYGNSTHNGQFVPMPNIDFVNPFSDNAQNLKTEVTPFNNPFGNPSNQNHNNIMNNVNLHDNSNTHNIDFSSSQPQLPQDVNLLSIPFDNHLTRNTSSSNLSDFSSNAPSPSPYISAPGSPYLNDYSENLSINNDPQQLQVPSMYLDGYTDFNESRLTVENLHNFSTTSSFQSSKTHKPSIKYEEVEDQARKTPSLFGGEESSNNNSPGQQAIMNNNNNNNNNKYGDSLLPSVNVNEVLGVPILAGHERNISTSDEQLSNMSLNFMSPISTTTTTTTAAAANNNNDTLLHPDDNHPGQGRPRRRLINSKNPPRSRSRSRSSERNLSLAENRDKILELASPNHSNKRQQKHPSIYACDLCDKKFTRPYNLKSHKRTHTDERPFICGTCGKAFARQHDKKRHEDLHTGEKRFQCRGLLKDGKEYWGCGKKFARIDALGRHFRTEAGKECIRPLVIEAEQEKTSQITNGDDFYQQILQQQQERQLQLQKGQKKQGVPKIAINTTDLGEMGCSPGVSPIDSPIPDFKITVVPDPSPSTNFSP